MRIGLTGGIASGKTMVSRRLAELGAAVLDADVFSRTAVEKGSEGALLPSGFRAHPHTPGCPGP